MREQSKTNNSVIFVVVVNKRKVKNFARKSIILIQVTISSAQNTIKRTSTKNTQSEHDFQKLIS